MAYCTQSDIEKRLPEATLIGLTDDAGAGTVDSDVVDAAIADAGEEIDAYLGLRHTLPLATVPAIVGQWAIPLSICALFARRSHINELPKQWADRCAAVRKQLEAVAGGKLSLGTDDPDGTPSQANAPQMSSANPARVFSRDDLGGF